MTTELEPNPPSGNGATPPDGGSDAAAGAGPAAARPGSSPLPGREPGDLVIAMSPRQILGGFAVLAAIVLMLLRRRGRRKG